jgi:hypothetical protein
MIELQLLAALGAFERTRERVQTHRPEGVGSPPHMLAAMGGLAAGWLARALIQGKR